MSSESELARVLARTGLAFPRGLLGEEARALAAAIIAGGPEPELLRPLVVDVAAAHWDTLRGPVESALLRAAAQDAQSGGHDAAALDEAIAWASEPDPDNPLALALAARAGIDLAAATRRAWEQLDAVEAALDTGDAGRLTRAVGRIVVDLLDLDPEDFEPEIVAYVAREAEDGHKPALEELARVSGDADLRTWARETLRELEAPGTPAALLTVRGLGAGELPDDPALDAVWVATIEALAEEAVEIALAAELDAAPPPPSANGRAGSTPA
ncbi:MAG: hypothetical protein QOK40_3028 [Miltoncostaeaceae bacterium]|nr:hypothetical protein [Miltoncostaeaceae bacterium]